MFVKKTKAKCINSIPTPCLVDGVGRTQPSEPVKRAAGSWTL